MRRKGDMMYAEVYGEEPTVAHTLDLSYNEIHTNLDVFYDELCKAEHIILDGNDIERLELPFLPNIRTLSLNRNKIEDYWGLLESLREACPQLAHLSLIHNPGWPHPITGASPDDYAKARQEVAYHLRNLRFLDSQPVQRFREIRPTGTSAETPQPFVTSFVRQRVEYSGLHSEGNRFIGDQQL